ncbi:MAG: hypothetical protein K0S28_944 [Paucimonas sp.]|nr:hypothetical protein [Paucimonas sp.]
MAIQPEEVSHIIQIAVAPVFLLSGVGTNLMVQTTRLARIIDRSRVLEDRLSQEKVVQQEADEAELQNLYRRSHLINRAITLSTASALMVCLVIALLFVGDAFRFPMPSLIAILFVAAMVTLIGSLIYLLREIFVATSSLNSRRPTKRC